MITSTIRRIFRMNLSQLWVRRLRAAGLTWRTAIRNALRRTGAGSGRWRGLHGRRLRPDFFWRLARSGAFGLLTARARQGMGARLQRLPTALGRDSFQPELICEPACRFSAGPGADAVRGIVQTSTQFFEQFGLEHPPDRAVAPTLIAKRFRARRVVTSDQLLDPTPSERSHPRRFSDAVTPRDKPNGLELPRGPDVGTGEIPIAQFIDAQMGRDFRHVPLPHKNGRAASLALVERLRTGAVCEPQIMSKGAYETSAAFRLRNVARSGQI